MRGFRKHLRAIAALLILGVMAFTCVMPVQAQVTLVGGGGASTGGTNDWTGTNNFTSPFSVYQTTTHTGNNHIDLLDDGTDGFIRAGTGAVVISQAGGTPLFSVDQSGRAQFRHDSNFGFGLSTGGSQPNDTRFVRAAAGVFGLFSGDWVQNTNARSMLAGDFTNATATFAATALSITVKTGRKYTFQAVLFLIDSTAAEGSQIDFNGGGATATNFRVHCLHYDTTAAVLKSTQVAALATVADSVASTGTGQNQVVCNGSFEPSGNGTFIIRGAQVSHTTGTLTINRGSYLSLEDMP